MLKRVQTATDQTLQLIRRVGNRHHGMGEGDLLRLVQACVLSRTTYAALYERLTAADTAKFGTMIRRTTKAALGSPHHASTAWLLGLDIQNVMN